VSRRLLAIAAMLGATSTARAANPTVIDVDLDGAKPDVRVRIRVPAGSYAADDFRLQIADGGRADGPAVTGSTDARFGAGEGEHFAIVIAVQADRAFFGCPNGPELSGTVAGAVDALLKEQDQAREVPNDRREYALVLFGDTADTEGVHLVPRDAFAPRDLLTPGHSHCTNENPPNLPAAIKGSVDLLPKSDPRHLKKVLVLISDNQAQADENDLAYLHGNDVDAYHLIHLPGGVMGRAVGQPFPVTDDSRFEAKAQEVAQAIDSEYWVVFPAAGLPFDGATHRLSISVKGGDPAPAYSVELPSRRSSRLMMILIGAGIAVALIALALAIGGALRRRKKPPPATADRPKTAVLPPEERPVPRKTRALEPRKTVALSQWDGPKGVAGWLVTLGGKTPYVTFVLNRTGETTIGVSDECGISLDDGAMSSKHCKVIGKSGYFTIVDTNSKNGVRVDGKVISEPTTLRSGVEIVIGETKLVFKSISPQAAGA
jgi:hypothetical protein